MVDCTITIYKIKVTRGKYRFQVYIVIMKVLLACGAIVIDWYGNVIII